MTQLREKKLLQSKQKTIIKTIPCNINILVLNIFEKKFILNNFTIIKILKKYNFVLIDMLLLL